ncbi:VOC family protein [Paenibacillus lycopersici]|uniref:VOC family protein n=1 Tax=Paenibacillus lycopersici TaxID=2704462 RepID=A0A6C0G3E7_9BACL|nr:VOC family protein [Paenibacillus lycopersici]QHT62533.1 VOC family protein [Paenibacillus lycopersici]
MLLQMTPFIFLDGNANEAIRFYEDALDAELTFKQTFGDAPADPNHPLPVGVKDRIAHSILKAGDAELFVADVVPGKSTQSGNKVSICITTNDRDQAQRYYDALQQGGQVVSPLKAVYFSPAYGIVTDKFGVTFQIFTARPR